MNLIGQLLKPIHKVAASLARITQPLAESAAPPKAMQVRAEPSVSRNAESPPTPPVLLSLPTPQSVLPEANSPLQKVVDAVRQKYPVVLVHGRAGTGKTTLIKNLRHSGLRYVVVAPTGIAALNAGGETIHKFFRIPPRIINLNEIAESHRIRTILRHIDCLVIDEVSMVRADLMDAIDHSLKINLNNHKPFGGLPIVMVGDFLQLPPIATREDEPILRNRNYSVFYAFGAHCLTDIPVKRIELSTIYRQTDLEFIELLGRIRIASDLERTVETFNRRCFRQHRSSTDPIMLTTRIADAESYNRNGMEALPGPTNLYRGLLTSGFRVERDKLPAPFELTLKVNARVMFVKNDPERRWFNGSLATVTRMSVDSVWVRLDRNEMEYEAHPATWESIEYRGDPVTGEVNPEVVGTYTQIPLQHAWAMTIHKAQGLTLEDVRVDVGVGAFSCGQTYVALSRATSLDGLSLARELQISDVKAETKLVAVLDNFPS